MTGQSHSNIVYRDCIPIQLYVKPKDQKRHDMECRAYEKAKRANKTFATVKLSNSNPHYRRKCGEVVDRKDDGSICLHIETRNYCYPDGRMTLAVAGKHDYSDVWFNADEVENVVSYDSKGKKRKETR